MRFREGSGADELGRECARTGGGCQNGSDGWGTGRRVVFTGSSSLLEVMVASIDFRRVREINDRDSGVGRRILSLGDRSPTEPPSGGFPCSGSGPPLTAGWRRRWRREPPSGGFSRFRLSARRLARDGWL